MAVPSSPSLEPDVRAISRAARWWFATFVVEVVALITDLVFHVRILTVVANVIATGTMAFLVWTLRTALPRRDRWTMPVLTSIGLLGVVVEFASQLGGPIGASVIPLASIATVLYGGWLVGLGGSRPTLPPPLPRRAVIGGMGWLLTGLATNDPLQPIWLALVALGALLSLFALGFVFGLIDLDRSTVGMSGS